MAISGSCHCGSICIEVDTAPSEVTACNCSICPRYDVLWAYCSPKQVRMTPPDAVTVAYQRDDRSITFHRCPTWGCVSHWAAVDPTRDRMGVNARLMAPDVVASARVRRLDGADTWQYLD